MSILMSIPFDDPILELMAEEQPAITTIDLLHHASVGIIVLNDSCMD
jgi:hypothetical protein